MPSWLAVQFKPTLLQQAILRDASLQYVLRSELHLQKQQQPPPPLSSMVRRSEEEESNAIEQMTRVIEGQACSAGRSLAGTLASITGTSPSRISAPH